MLHVVIVGETCVNLGFGELYLHSRTVLPILELPAVLTLFAEQTVPGLN